ncbi:MAG: DUF5063 domain-containing protein [Tannerella sp.]|jgi:hypothetical protein|nr:DUF5063 domain-containing protein [Tannerella sp.]
MEKANHPVYDKNTLEFVTVAFEFCAWIERTGEYNLTHFVGNAVKLLPLLYLKASLLPEVADEDDETSVHFITEETYNAIRSRMAKLLGEYDDYLETFLPDMPYSDTPIAASISENLADMYQDIGNFVALFRQGYEKTMLKALAACTATFRQYWGQSLLNALKALHCLCYNEDINLQDKGEA